MLEMSGSQASDSSSPMVIGTKLRVPSPRREQMLRPRLMELLDEGLDGKVTLISAPAGYGKTTVLSQLLASEEKNGSFAWVSLDEQDNDPIRMWRHIVEALALAMPGKEFGGSVVAALSVTGARVVDTVVSMLVNQLGEVPQKVSLVLDDYQFATNDECRESMDFFVEHLPDNVHLVLATRSDPPLHLGRLRARGALSEIRTEQLAFTEEETAYLLNEKMGLDIGPDDLAVLLDRTEGWPAGMYLAVLSMKGKEDAHGFIRSFGGSNRYILDLLGEEVLAGLPEAERAFMLETSVLSKMTGSLCDEVVGGEGSGELLDELARSNLFVVALDEYGGWYRYHHLFSDLLLYELKRSRPDLMPVLHGRASAWFEEEGLFEDAIRHALASSDYERAGKLLARHWFRYAVTGQLASLERWLEALPDDLTIRDAPLVLVKAWMCAIYGRREESERLLRLAESLPYAGRLPDGSAAVESETTVIRATFGYGSVKSMVATASRSAELATEQDSPWRMPLVKMALGQSSYLSGDISTARKSLDEALAMVTVDQPLWRIGALYLLSVVATDEGRLDEAESLAREARSLVETYIPHGSRETSAVYIALGRVFAERGKLDEAQTELERGLSASSSQDVNPWTTLLGLLSLARVREARGDRAGARMLLDEARDVVEAYPDAGIFPELLERQEHELGQRRQRETALTEVLTDRELAVLRLFDGDDTYRQIGQSLYVSVNTVKTHVRSIFRKLGVSSRDEALERARKRALI
jgi:LuxR family transcriptional regulator, maltose regulon positive regulatory protein